jgi:predicted metalloprotease with PDZ domain
MIRHLFGIALLGAAPVLAAQAAPGSPLYLQSAPVQDISYRVTFDRALAERRVVHVDMNFRTDGDKPVVLSLPAWTPGAYEISYFARWTIDFGARGDGRPLTWEKSDYDTWRVMPAGAKQITVSFDYVADTLDNAMAWAKPDFLLFNGTNLFLYPEGRGFDFPATVRIVTDDAWRVVTGMTPAASANTYTATNYHDLVDMPFFVGRVGLDSTRVGDGWARLAWYPVASVPPAERAAELSQIARLIPVESAVFGETPWKVYTVMQIADSSYGGLSGLEHQNSHVDIITPLAVGDPILSAFYAHEIFHAWNVKRLRPIDLWPYQYAREQPTTWLWVSEGITDYYADLAQVRAGLIDTTGFFEATAHKIGHVTQLQPVALADASLDTWIHVVDGTDDIYYDKGSLAGLLLDILIRDASDNKRSLDDVMRQLYREEYKKNAGFTAAQWWSAVSAAAGGKPFADFNARYVEGREPYPFATVLPLAGLRMTADTLRLAFLGVQTRDSAGAVIVLAVAHASTAMDAGVRGGDELVAVGDVSATAGANWAAKMRERYRTPGEAITIKVKRDGTLVALNGHVQHTERVTVRVGRDPKASAKAAAIGASIMHP